MNPLIDNISKYIHGNEDKNTIKHINNIKNIISEYKNDNFEIIDFHFYEGCYSSYEKNKEILDNSKYNDFRFTIILKYNGYCNCEATIDIFSGTRGSIPIYYFDPYKNNIKIKQINELELKFNELLRQGFINEIVNLAFKDEIYLNFSDNYNIYEIWDKKPSSYSNSIRGGYSDEYNEEMITNLKKLGKCSNIEKYSKSKMDGEEQKITWIDYSL
jgi:hypothetical protein